jgi:hypothetical protein
MLIKERFTFSEGVKSRVSVAFKSRIPVDRFKAAEAILGWSVSLISAKLTSKSSTVGFCAMSFAIPPMEDKMRASPSPPRVPDMAID